jgi:hypothetical protein
MFELPFLVRKVAVLGAGVTGAQIAHGLRRRKQKYGMGAAGIFESI